jgi:hypothetical protein
MAQPMPGNVPRGPASVAEAQSPGDRGGPDSVGVRLHARLIWRKMRADTKTLKSFLANRDIKECRLFYW